MPFSYSEPNGIGKGIFRSDHSIDRPLREYQMIINEKKKKEEKEKPTTTCNKRT